MKLLPSSAKVSDQLDLDRMSHTRRKLIGPDQHQWNKYLTKLHHATGIFFVEKKQTIGFGAGLRHRCLFSIYPRFIPRIAQG